MSDEQPLFPDAQDANDAHDPYAVIAAWYDREHDALTADGEMYHELLTEHADGETDVAGRLRVLEVGAGSGRLAAALAVSGCAVVGAEPSAAMRERAAHRLKTLPDRVARRIQIVAGTATDLALTGNEPFDAVIYGLNTFAHLLTSGEREQALRATSARLKMGGLLAIDLDLAGPRRLLKTAGQLWRLDTWRMDGMGRAQGKQGDEVEYVTHFAVGAASAEPDILTVTHFYDAHAQGGPVRRSVATTSFALLSRGEVELALRYTGFTVTAVYGAYDLTPYEEGASRAILVARRVGG